jgi:hypothetical protein
VYARVHTLETTPEQHDEGLRIIKEQLLPWTREATGFRGMVGLSNRERTKSLVITLWDDESSLRESEPAGVEFGDLTSALTGANRRALDDYEVTIFETT